MKKVILSIITSLFLMTLVLAQNGAQDTTGPYHDEIIAAGGQNGTPMLISTMAGQEIKTGRYTGENGQQIQIQQENQNRFQLMSNGISANCNNCNLTQEQFQGRTQFKIQLSNGENSEIKIMPNTASETALQRLRLKNCNESNNCSIELKEVGSGINTRAAYEMQIQRHSRILGLFQAKMQNTIQVSAENGEIIKTNKPWWAFLATESTEE